MHDYVLVHHCRMKEIEPKAGMKSFWRFRPIIQETQDNAGNDYPAEYEARNGYTYKYQSQSDIITTGHENPLVPGRLFSCLPAYPNSII
ncbi:MAG TPA: hypothetical protein V6C99_03090, partial [Oculatellaceae cyanobacterium]